MSSKRVESRKFTSTKGNDESKNNKPPRPNESKQYGRIVECEEGGYRWMPYTLTFEQVRTYYDNNFATEEIPYLNTDGDLNRMNALFQQLPKQDLDAHFCTALKYDREIKYNQFMNMRNSKYFDVGIPRLNEKFLSLKCRGCSKGIDIGSFFIQSMIKFNNESVGGDDSKELTMETLKNSCFHPKCFKCVRCNQDLVDLAHCLLKNKLYCVRHFGEQFRPRCDHCEEVGYSH